MGCRAHYASTYKVEWKGNDFNYAAESLYGYLVDNGCANVHTSDEDTAYCEWEIEKESLAAFIKEQEEKDPNEAVVDRDEETQYTRKETLEVLRTWLTQSDPDIDYIRISWH